MMQLCLAITHSTAKKINMPDVKQTEAEAAARALVYVVAALMLIAMFWMIGLFLSATIEIETDTSSQVIEEMITPLEQSENATGWHLPW